MSNAIQRFQAIGHMRGGRISGFLGRSRETFFLTKVLREVPHIDAEGRAVRVSQWIIELEAPIDITTLLRDGEDAETVLMQATAAGQVLEGAPQENEPMRSGYPTLEQLLGRVKAMGIHPGQFQQYAQQRWGNGWKINPHGRGRAWDEIERYANDPEGYADKIDSATDCAVDAGR
jgi:hypothetical protein